jgi:hypothetical protein
MTIADIPENEWWPEGMPFQVFSRAAPSVARRLLAVSEERLSSVIMHIFRNGFQPVGQDGVYAYYVREPVIEPVILLMDQPRGVH